MRFLAFCFLNGDFLLICTYLTSLLFYFSLGEKTERDRDRDGKLETVERWNPSRPEEGGGGEKLRPRKIRRDNIETGKKVL
jgi:hypothetical protein